LTQGVLKRKLPTPPGGPGARRTAMDVYDALRDAILGGEIKSGSLLTQVDIARDFGVSRTPVREALRRLQESGLVAGAPNYRSRVVGFDAEEVESIYVKRLLLEGFSAHCAAGNVLSPQLIELRSILARLHEKLDASPAAFVGARQHLHASLSAGAGASMRRDIVELQRRCLQFEQRADRARDPGARDSIFARYKAIVDAVARADAPRAARLIVQTIAAEARDSLRIIAPDHASVGTDLAEAFTIGQLNVATGTTTDEYPPLPMASIGRIDPIQNAYLADAPSMASEVAVPSRGRPRDASKREAILAAAHELFLKFGPDAITMHRLAGAANVSKGTLYANFEDKDSVIEAWVRRESELMISDAWKSEKRDASLVDALTDLGQHLLSFLANPQHLALQRIVFGIAGRDRVLGERLFHAGPARIQGIIKDILRKAQGRGEISVEDVADAADDLVGLWQGFLAVELSFHQPPAPMAAHLRARAARGVEQFLKLYGSRSPRRAS
jgi:TetR/AcrR family transcriptional regulator, mexJK operon transcriptional repressor